MRRRKRDSSRRRPRLGKSGAKALAAATAVAGGTHAYADAIRFDNKDGEFDWGRCGERVWLDVTKPAGAQDGQRNPGSFQQYRTCKDCDLYATIWLTAASGDWVGDYYCGYYGYGYPMPPLENGYLIQAQLPGDYFWLNPTSIECYYCQYWGFGQTGYAGIRFQADDGLHYGWIKTRLTKRKRPDLRALAWGYETEPNKPIQAGDGVPPPRCTGKETMGVNCKPARKDFKITAAVKKAMQGLAITFRLDQDPNTDQEKVVNSRGKARAKFTGVSPGQHTVEEKKCELRKDATCEP